MSDEKPNTDTPSLTKPPGFDLNDIAWASLLGDRGHLDEAITLLEKHADASDEIFYAESTRFKMLRAARDGDWSLGLGLWESHCERLVKRNTFLDERNVDGYALFFLGYANEWLAEGNVEEAFDGRGRPGGWPPAAWKRPRQPSRCCWRRLTRRWIRRRRRSRAEGGISPLSRSTRRCRPSRSRLSDTFAHVARERVPIISFEIGRFDRRDHGRQLRQKVPAVTEFAIYIHLEIKDL